MARNLYEMGDAPTQTDAWLNDQQERRARIIPRGALVMAVLLGGAAFLVLREMAPDPNAKAVTPTTVIDNFSACDDPTGEACVLATDRYAWRGRTYVLADIRAPSASAPHCPQEAELAQQGRATLLALMNGGAFEAQPAPTSLSGRILIRDGVSLGSLLILKGFAKPAGDEPVDWCAAV
jgi:hypothetical protein